MPAIPYINSQNARELQRKGVQIRMARRRTVLPQSELPVNTIEMTTVLPERAAHTLAIVDKLVVLMDRAGDDERKLDCYSRAYDRVFKAWMVLSGTPGSGQRKPPPMRQQRGQSYPQPEVMLELEPAPAAPTPQPVANCGVTPAPPPAPAPQDPNPAS